MHETLGIFSIVRSILARFWNLSLLHPYHWWPSKTCSSPWHNRSRYWSWWCGSCSINLWWNSSTWRAQPIPLLLFDLIVDLLREDVLANKILISHNLPHPIEQVINLLEGDQLIDKLFIDHSSHLHDEPASCAKSINKKKSQGLTKNLWLVVLWL